MNIQVYPRGADVRLSPHFHLREFECQCGSCPETRVDLDHVERLEALRARLGEPIRITSAFRCPAHNRAIGGHRTSEHMEGLATDVQVGGVSPATVAAIADDMGSPGSAATTRSPTSTPATSPTRAGSSRGGIGRPGRRSCDPGAGRSRGDGRRDRPGRRLAPPRPTRPRRTRSRTTLGGDAP